MEAQNLAVANPLYPKSMVLKEEVRFAVVMYGGISLCIYMNGITDQLWHAVRATARKGDDVDPDGYLIDLDGNKRNTDWYILRVYRRLAQLRTTVDKRRTGPGQPEPFRPYGQSDDCCRFVVDILSGTSAGGINSLFLSKALACEQTLASLSQLWIEDGDISQLINDSGSVEPGIPNEVPPQSLLNSRRMAQKLLDAFRDMKPDEGIPDAGRTGASRLVQQLDLFMTSTDLAGLDLSLGIPSDRKITELRHKAVFHFVNDPLDAPAIGSEGGGRNDFIDEMVPFLAFVARATSCIVPAFEPMELNDIGKLQDDDAPQGTNYTDSGRYAPFYRDYWSNSNIAAAAAASSSASSLADQMKQKQEEFATRAFGDGGYGNNYPFNWAVDSLATRRAELKVDRKLLYVEPDPDLPGATTTASGAARPNVLEHASGAVGVMTSQPIREQIDRLRERNRSLAHMTQIKQAIGGQTKKLPVATDAYLKLRSSGTTDDLADLLCSLFGFEKKSIYWEAIRYVAHTVREHRFPGSDDRCLRQFLKRFDLGFRQRKIGYLVGLADDMMITDQSVETVRKAKAALLRCDTYLDQWLAAVRLHGTAFAGATGSDEPVGPDKQRYKGLKDRIWAELGLPKRRDLTVQIRELKAAADAIIKIDDLAEIVTTTSDYVKRQELADKAVVTEGIDPFVKALQKAVTPIRAAIDGRIKAEAAKFAPAGWSESFEGLDAWLYPAYYVSGSPETNKIDILRVSPLDCKSLVSNGEEAKHKLAGTGLGHFSGFFHPAWRGQDVIWGRLDGAERMICSVVDQDCFERSLLICQAQAAILAMKDVDMAVDTAIRGMPNLPELAPTETMEAFRSTHLKNALDSLLREAAKRAPKDQTTSEYDLGNSNYDRLLRKLCDPDGTFGNGSSALYDVLSELLAKAGIYGLAKLEPRYELELGGRALKVVGNVLTGVSKDPTSPHKTAKTVAQVGAGIVAVAKIVTPGSIEGSLYQNWLALLVALTAVMLGIGIFNETIQKAGWSLLGVTVMILGAVELTRLALTDAATRTRYVKIAGAIGLLAIVCGFGYWVFSSWTDSTTLNVGARVLAAGLTGACIVFLAGAWSVIARALGPTPPKALKASRSASARGSAAVPIALGDTSSSQRPSLVDVRLFKEALITLVIFVASIVAFVAAFYLSPLPVAGIESAAIVVLSVSAIVGFISGVGAAKQLAGAADQKRLPTSTEGSTNDRGQP